MATHEDAKQIFHDSEWIIREKYLLYIPNEFLLTIEFTSCQAATISHFASANSSHDANTFSNVSLVVLFLLIIIEIEYR